MDRAAIFSPEGPALADVAQALEALGVRLTQQDLEKTAENVALLARHWRTLALDAAAPDGAK